MRLLIYGINFSPELTGIGKYTGEMAEWLSDRGHQVRVITAPPYYPAWKISEGFSTWKYSKETFKDITTFRCPLWVPEKPKTFTRLVHLLSFSFSSLPVLFRQIIFWRPDAVVCIAPSFFCAPQAVFLSKMAGVKSWLHFQDFEICAMFGSGMALGGKRTSKIAHKAQSFITRRFDSVSSISHTMCSSATNNNVSRNKVIIFPNWVDIDFITPEADGVYFRQKWGINAETMVVLYSGNIGKKQGLNSLIDAANNLGHRNDIQFVVVGDGAHKSSLIKRCKEKKVKNIQFHSLQSYDLLPNLLRMADIHLIIQKRGAADTVLPSKLTSILSVGGHSIITAEPETELGQIVLANPGIATLVPPEDVRALIYAINSLCDDTLIGRGQLNKQARKYAEEHLGKETVLKKFEQDLQKMLCDKGLKF